MWLKSYFMTAFVTMFQVDVGDIRPLLLRDVIAGAALLFDVIAGVLLLLDVIVVALLHGLVDDGFTKLSVKPTSLVRIEESDS